MALAGRYTLKRLLGSGGAGQVFLAHDRARGDLPVALKRIRAEVDDLLRAAFEREFSIMASLSVPGIAQVFDFGVAQASEAYSGGPFFTRAYVEGQPLGEAALHLAVEERLGLFLRVCDVIAPLHRVGVTHGDIKPGNVIVTVSREVSVIDFGLSRVLDRSRKVEPGGGTPAFMAPELLQGAPSSVGGDIYALGSLLWQLVTGRVPFADLGPLSISAKLSGQAPKAPDGSTQLMLGVLEIAERALRYDPLDRFPTVNELKEALSSLVPRPPALQAPFVPPRPCGHEAVLQQLEGPFAAGRLNGDASRLRLLTGAHGSGKSLLLRELRWRLQLRGFQVLDFTVPPGSGRASQLWFLEQLRLLLGDSEGAVSPRAVNHETPLTEWVASEVASLLTAAAPGGPIVLLVDDLDLAERTLGEVLRSALFDERAEGAVLLAAAAEPQAPAVTALGADGQVAVSPLSPESIAALSREALGPVDDTVISALTEVTQGMPAGLMDALSSLSSSRAPTARDVRALEPGQAAAALAQARLSRIPQAAIDLLWLLSLVDAAPIPLAERLLSSAKVPGQEALRSLEQQGVLTRRGGDIWFSDVALGKTLRRPCGAEADEERVRARNLLATIGPDELPVVARARLSVAAQDAALLRQLAPEALQVLRAAEAPAAAVALNEALLPHLHGAEADAVRLQIARDRQAMGEHAEAADLAVRLAREGDLSVEQKSDAALVGARALTALARYDEAVGVLGLAAAVSEEQASAQRAQVLRELARVHMRRGDYDAVLEAADAGLALLAEDDLARVELLCSKGAVAAYREDPDAALGLYDSALSLAERAGSHRDLAKVFAYKAIRCARAGDLEAARPFFEDALRNARVVGDIGLMANASLNLGGILFYLGDAAGAESHYQTASRLSRRAGSISTDIQVRNNLAHLHVYLGLYERARGELEQVLAEAQSRGHRYLQAQVRAVYGDLYARCGDLDRSLIAYDDAIARYRELGQLREVAEHHLDAAEALLDRSGSADVSAAAERLSAAREIITSHGHDDLNFRRELLTARARLASGEADSVLGRLEELARQAEAEKKRELQWSALFASARAHLALGAEFAAASHFRRAVEILEEQAVRLPREYRDAFWHDPRRRAVRAELSALADSSHRHLRERVELATALSDPRMSRLLEIVKRLAVEHDLTRLLERIVDSAVELSGAERGLVLLTDQRGQLAPHLARGQAGLLDESVVMFSRSIAEAVLIDGDSIVSMDASHDGRLSEYASVHNLSLRSVACLPIRSMDAVVGVLYLEHRRSRTCFTDSVVDLLRAFADQAAIALVNARLLRENEQRQVDLERANLELASAKRQLEDALSARTEELTEVRDELARVSGGRQRHLHYGMVGNSPAMMRVFAAIERLKDAAVPVVIRGESGTGKELVARAIHYAGIRRQAPFVPVNCGALPDSLLESELFGYVRGAFSGADRQRTGLIAKAHGGTLFLDEVADMPAKMQVDLLRVLQEGSVCKLGSDVEERVSVRFVAATQRDLRDLVAEGKFREDLYYRLNVIEIELPPLRQRREDIPELCTHMLRNFCNRDGLPERRLNAAALRALMAAELPGNVRQLEHMLMQATLMSASNSISPSDLNLEVEEEEVPSSLPPPPGPGEEPLAGNLEEYRDLEKRRILQALEACGWNRARAAQSLGMARRTFYRRLQEYQIL